MIQITTGVPIDYVPQDLYQWGLALGDYEWWASRYCPIADKETTEPHPLRLNASQQYLKWYIETFRNDYGGGNYLVYKGRQFGMSTMIDTMFAHQATKGPGFRAMVFAHETSAADNLLSIIRRPYWNMPESQLLPSGDNVTLKPAGQHRENKKELWVYFDGDRTRESRVMIEEATAGETAGAGFALNALHFSEVGKDAFDDGRAIGIAMQTLSMDALVFAEGTANGAYGWMYNTWQEVWDEFRQFRLVHKHKPEIKWNSWVPVFLPWFWHYGYPGGLRFPLAEHEEIKAETEWEERAMSGENTYLHYKCTPENIKAMRYLFNNRIKSAASDSGLSAEEYRVQEYPSNPEEGFIVSGSTFFTKEILREGMRFAREYCNTHEILKYKWDLGGFKEDKYGEFRFIKEPEPDKFKYVVSGDVASGQENKDWDTAQLIEIRANGPNILIGYWRAHESDKYMHAILMRDLAEWCKASVVAIENNVEGGSVNDHLRLMGCRGLYVATPEDEGSFQAGFTKRYGWHTSQKSRGIMLGQLQASLRRWYESPSDPDGLVVPFPEIWNEAQAFVRIHGKAQATRGANDDLIMGSAIGNSVAIDTVPKKAPKKDDPYDATIRHYTAIGMKTAVNFYKKLRKVSSG